VKVGDLVKVENDPTPWVIAAIVFCEILVVNTETGCKMWLTPDWHLKKIYEDR
jgi:hypothetical protein